MKHTVCIAATALVTLMSGHPGRPRGLARVYVYVQRDTPARSWLPVSCDGTVVAKVKRGKFFAINVTPGRHTLSDAKGIPAFVDVRPGGEAFVRLEWRNGERGGPAIPFPVWEAVTSSVASGDMLYLTYIDGDKALSKSVPKKDPRELPNLQLQRRNKPD